MLPLLILCGGLASRLYPTTKTIPKSLIMIEDTPFISYQLDLLYTRGIRDVILCVGKFGSMIEDYVGDGSFWGLRVKYSYEDENSLLGTGGAIKNAEHILPRKFMIMYGDSYLDVNYRNIAETYYKKKKPMLITIFRNKNIGDKSNIYYKNGKISVYDKFYPSPSMKYIDYGLLVVDRDIFRGYPEKFDLSVLMSHYVNREKVSSYITNIPFYEIGSKEGIKQFEDKQISLYL